MNIATSTFSEFRTTENTVDLQLRIGRIKIKEGRQEGRKERWKVGRNGRWQDGREGGREARGRLLGLLSTTLTLLCHQD